MTNEIHKSGHPMDYSEIDERFKVTSTVQRAARLLSNMSIHEARGGE